MTDDVLSRRCVPCRGGVARTPGWALVDKGRRIERKFGMNSPTAKRLSTL
jgi:hypothetical protein